MILKVRFRLLIDLEFQSLSLTDSSRIHRTPKQFVKARCIHCGEEMDVGADRCAFEGEPLFAILVLRENFSSSASPFHKYIDRCLRKKSSNFVGTRFSRKDYTENFAISLRQSEWYVNSLHYDLVMSPSIDLIIRRLPISRSFPKPHRMLGVLIYVTV